MTEDFLHYIWRYKRFSWVELKTTQNQSIELYLLGDHNHHAGPDFTNARIRINDTLWAGNVEMHLKASDWLKHGHQDDPAYNNVILHVVLDEDQPIYRANGERLPCLELRHYILPNLQQIYLRLQQATAWIPCQNQWHEASSLTQAMWLERLLIERLECKMNEVQQSLDANRGDWEETFFQLLAKNLGLSANSEPFEQLARSLSFKLLSRHRDNLLHLEALLLGQAGFLETTFEEPYPLQLQATYRFFQKKFQLTPMDKSCWKFLRMRPANFPTIRIAQLATLIYRTEHLFGKVMAAKNGTELKHLLEHPLHAYWTTHYLLDKPAAKSLKRLGETKIQQLVINAIAPTLFLYGTRNSETIYQEKALHLLEMTPAEDNHFIESWKKMGLKPQSAGETQALLQLKQKYCDQRRCLHCAIGHAIFQKE